MGAQPTQPRRRLKREDRRRVVMEAACQVFADRGHDAATVREIAGAAGVTVPVLYQHFASKSHLYVAILEEGGEQLIAAVVSTPQQGTPEQFLHGTFESFFGWVEEHPGHWRLIFRDAAADPVVAAAQTALFVRARRAIAGLFALTPSWALSSDVDQARAREMLAQLTMSALNGLAAWWWGNRDVPREQIVGTAMNLLWSGISALGRGGPFETEQAETKEDA